MRFANDRELPDICSRSACLVFCKRLDVEVEPEVEADDEDCLDEFEAGMPERVFACVDEEPDELGFGFGLGLLVIVSCLTRATGATWRGGGLGMELGPPVWSKRFFRSLTLGALAEGDLDVAADLRSRGFEAERMAVPVP